MKASAVWGLVVLALLAAYYALRFAAAACSGAGCEVFIPISLLLPLVCWVAAVTSCVLVLRNTPRWRGLLVPIALTSVIGPPVALLLFRDRPDQFVSTATALLLLAPISTLTSAILEGSRVPRGH